MSTVLGTDRVTALRHWALRQTQMPFIWGKTDCVSLVRHGLQCYGHPDYFHDIPWYSCLAGASRLNAAYGGIRHYLSNLGFRELALADAQTGDVLIRPFREHSGFPAVGLVIGGEVLIGHQASSPQLIPWPHVTGAVYVLRPPARTPD